MSDYISSRHLRVLGDAVDEAEAAVSRVTPKASVTYSFGSGQAAPAAQSAFPIIPIAIGGALLLAYLLTRKRR